ncbi:hypothetical protein [Frigoriflavimonas asaccharolytica]|uniref:Uncharacterized protein n=1 Tax=Frigoriflavimonas asaccharolytica TaxID=2735899 RepID=A0A8J8G9L5_9FLAO|nr:hypothetical protein [Frigoriflavimonas asaccharolytica]NRS93668.1 hypothetical protein [Frigoriflavimonas asaccharolytica]
MKNLLLGLSVCFATVLSAQNYPNNDWGNENNNNYSNNGYNNNGEGYFPDDYYYEYPEDYYSNEYYRDFYNDYRQSLQMINWSRFFREYNLSRRQISLILDLNNQFNSYNVWNSYYRTNPQRWYYDRYFAMERILGPSVYVVFQNRYYDGFNPVIYYNNRRNTFYRNNFRVRPAYVNININLYRVNRQQYHQSVGNNYGWKQSRNVSNGFVENGKRNANYTNDNSGSNNGFRNSNSGNTVAQNSVRNNSTRRNNGLQTATQQPRTRDYSTQATTISAVQQQPRIRNSSSVEPRRSTTISSSNTNSVRSEGSSSTRSSGNAERSSSNSQSSSSAGTRSSSGRR